MVYEEALSAFNFPAQRVIEMGLISEIEIFNMSLSFRVGEVFIFIFS